MLHYNISQYRWRQFIGAIEAMALTYNGQARSGQFERLSNHLVGISPLVVVPTHDLDKILIYYWVKLRSTIDAWAC